MFLFFSSHVSPPSFLGRPWSRRNQHPVIPPVSNLPWIDFSEIWVRHFYSSPTFYKSNCALTHTLSSFPRHGSKANTKKKKRFSVPGSEASNFRQPLGRWNHHVQLLMRTGIYDPLANGVFLFYPFRNTSYHLDNFSCGCVLRGRFPGTWKACAPYTDIQEVSTMEAQSSAIQAGPPQDQTTKATTFTDGIRYLHGYTKATTV